MSDAEGDESGGANGICCDHELRWPATRRLRGLPARKRDRDDGYDDTDM